MLDIVNDRRHGDNEEEAEPGEDSYHETEYGNGARGLPAEDAELLDLLHDGHQHDREERADVDDFEDTAQSPENGEQHHHGKEEQDVAADVTALLLLRSKCGRGGTGMHNQWHGSSRYSNAMSFCPCDAHGPGSR